MKHPSLIQPEQFSAALEGSDYGEAFLEESRGLSIRYEDSKVEDIGSVLDRGMGLRHLKKSGNSIRRSPEESGSGISLGYPSVRTFQAVSQKLDAKEALRLREALFGKEKPKTPIAFKPEQFYCHPARINPEDIPLEVKIKLLTDIDCNLRKEFNHIRQIALSYGERIREIAVLNSEGVFQREQRTAVLLSINVIVEENGVLQTGHEVIGGLKGYELLEDGFPMRLARAAAARAQAKLKAPKAKAGEMPVILSNSAGGTFIHEAIGHSLEVDHVQEGSSPAYKGKMGQVVAPEMITVIDDPTLPFYRGSFYFDDEGHKSQPTVLVKNGVLVDYLYDRVTAMKEGKTSNGHGRRESFHCRPIPRMSNLYIAPGPHDPKEILKGLKAGVFVTRMGGGQVNTATGEFVFELDDAFWVENGEIKHRVRDANLLGIGPDILRSIDKVGSDIGWGIGTCGKDGQSVPVGDGQPTIHIPKILIGGGGEK
jgi:TldD protein